MPKISEFNGVSIYLYYDDHNPPHFHAIHGSNEIVVRISPIKILSGYFPAKIRGAAERWGKANAAALLANWEKMKQGEPPNRIPG